MRPGDEKWFGPQGRFFIVRTITRVEVTDLVTRIEWYAPSVKQAFTQAAEVLLDERQDGLVIVRTASGEHFR